MSHEDCDDHNDCQMNHGGHNDCRMNHGGRSGQMIHNKHQSQISPHDKKPGQSDHSFVKDHRTLCLHTHEHQQLLARAIY